MSMHNFDRQAAAYATGPVYGADPGYPYAAEPVYAANPGYAYAAEPVYAADSGYAYAAEPVYATNSGHAYATEPVYAADSGYAYAAEPVYAADSGYAYAAEPVYAADSGYAYTAEPVYTAAPGYPYTADSAYAYAAPPASATISPADITSFPTAPPLPATAEFLSPNQLFAGAPVNPADSHVNRGDQHECGRSALAFPSLRGAQKTEPEENSSADKRRKMCKLIFDLLTYAFALLLILGSTMFAFSNDTGKSLPGGFRYYHVLTQSMVPFFKPGAMIFTKFCDTEDIKEGDVITYVPNQKYNAYLTHRVVQILHEEDGTTRFITKGDFNNAEDPPIPSSAVVGKYIFHIPMAGSIVSFIRKNLLVMCICIGATFALILLLRSYFSAKKTVRQAQSAPVPVPSI
ncbi:MAG: signal peptidase I [Oscillospiraceae bacterium]|jgi:signal peptidase|nr:signal peptidase I [Oscillospiraceae bacterium]